MNILFFRAGHSRFCTPVNRRRFKNARISSKAPGSLFFPFHRLHHTGFSAFRTSHVVFLAKAVGRENDSEKADLKMRAAVRAFKMTPG